MYFSQQEMEDLETSDHEWGEYVRMVSENDDWFFYFLFNFIIMASPEKSQEQEYFKKLLGKSDAKINKV